MSTHIAAQPGQIAPIVLFPGDPLRAKWIAETFLEGAELYTETRGMLGFTGTWNGIRYMLASCDSLGFSLAEVLLEKTNVTEI